MLGLGETIDELLDTCADLRRVGCEMLTLGQYLRPTPDHLPVERYDPPEEFDEIGKLVKQMGFKLVASGPFVRSSYHAGEMAAVLGREVPVHVEVPGRGVEPPSSRTRPAPQLVQLAGP